jgi:DNA-binding CsgD family transcriptional regulator
MLVFGTEMHLATFIISALELIMFIFVLSAVINRPAEKQRALFLVLLGLLIIYNIVGGLLPNPKYEIPVYLQNIIAFGSAFLMASYVPFYFYKAFNLELLRFHVHYGVVLFFLLPYLIFFVISYSVHKNLEYAIHYGLIIPSIYSMVLLWTIRRAVYDRHKNIMWRGVYVQEFLAYCAVLPWGALSVITYFNWGQFYEALVTNMTFIPVTIIYILRVINEDRNELQSLKEMAINGGPSSNFYDNCKFYDFTARELEIASLLHENNDTSYIALKLDIAKRTLSKHIENMMRKTKTHSRIDLLRKLEYGNPEKR